MDLDLIAPWRRSYRWRNRARDPALTTMLAVQCLILLAAPLAAMGYDSVRQPLQLLFFIFTFLVCLLSRGLIATALAILALTCALTGSLLQLVTPSDASLILAFAGSIGAFIVVTYSLAGRGSETAPNAHGSDARRSWY